MVGSNGLVYIGFFIYSKANHIINSNADYVYARSLYVGVPN